MPTIPLEHTMVTLCQLHPLPFDLDPPLCFNYQLEHTFVLDGTLFEQALTTAPHLFSNGMFRMVYEHIFGCFKPKNPSSWFLKLSQVVTIVAHGDIPRSVALMLGANKLFAMVKDIRGFCPIIIDEAFFQFISYSILLQF